MGNVPVVVDSAAFSPDGSRIVSEARDETLRVWNEESCEQIENVSGYGDISAIAAGPSAFPLRGMIRASEFQVEESLGGAVIARFCGFFFSVDTHPSGRTWALRTELGPCILTLDGIECVS